MINFDFQIKTKIYFGKDKQLEIGNILKELKKGMKFDKGAQKDIKSTNILLLFFDLYFNNKGHSIAPCAVL